MNYREAARKLQALGCHELPRKGGGSHRKWHNPAANRTTVMPDHGSKELKLGTLRAVVNNWGWIGRRFKMRDRGEPIGRRALPSPALLA